MYCFLFSIFLLLIIGTHTNGIIRIICYILDFMVESTNLKTDANTEVSFICDSTHHIMHTENSLRLIRKHLKGIIIVLRKTN